MSSQWRVGTGECSGGKRHGGTQPAPTGRRWRLAACYAVAAVWLISGCTPLMRAAGVEPEVRSVQAVPGGDPQRGAIALQAYGCGTCHTIPGVVMANALVGPPLNGWGERRYIAGRLLNEPQHLVEWIRFPQAIEPGTAMPNLGVTEQDARDMAAYLYTLRRE